MKLLNEDTLAEQPVLDWLKQLDYEYEHGSNFAPEVGLEERKSLRDVVLTLRLQRSLRRLNPERSDKAIDEAVRHLVSFSHPSEVIANKEVHKMLLQGIPVEDRIDGTLRPVKMRIIDFQDADNNEFLVVNQLAIQGPERLRRPDVLIYVNGLPLVIFEVKSPTSFSGTVGSAFTQVNKYKKDIPEVFKYNQIIILSDQQIAKHGTISSAWEWFGTWKGIKDENDLHPEKTELEVLVKGMFHKERLLDIVKNFIVFEADRDGEAASFTKKMCLYHQYFGVHKAVAETLRAAGEKGNNKIGVYWHTQGSGKSLSMVFYANKTREIESLRSPTFLFLTDRNDLDGQLHKTFLRTGYPTAVQADSIQDLKARLRQAGAGLIFTTIQKFDAKQELLSENSNIIVIADEAHRSQYRKFASNVRDALPNASFMGITGTPVSLHDRDTRMVFGDYISTYEINRAVEDKATVPIYYEGRLIPLHLANQFLDEQFSDLVNQEFEVEETYKRKWARLEQAVSANDRIDQIAKDIVEHFNNRGLEGKGMVVAISRRAAVNLYKALKQQRNAPEIAVVISNPQEFAKEIQADNNNRNLERRFKDAKDPLKLVIVCDMWLTGFDVPPLHTMYIDKPLRNHTLMQTIARVNRIYRDKPGGLIVDYIGIADNIKKALAIYSSGIQKQAMIPIETVIDKMKEEYDIVSSMFPDVDYRNWKNVEPFELTEIFQAAVNCIVSDALTGAIDEKRKEQFLKHTDLLVRIHALVMPHKEATEIRDDVEFFQALKQTIIKKTIIIDTGAIGPDVESAVRELISKSIAAEGVVDILAMKKKGKPDISILDENFLAEVKNMKYKNLAIETLRKLLNDELQTRLRKNVVRYESLLQLLRDTIEEYENNIINSAKVIERLIELAQQIKKAEHEGKQLGLSDDEVAFYDLMAQGKHALKNGELRELVRELVSVIRRDLSVDWSSRENIQARIRANVKLLLIRKKVPTSQIDNLLELIFRQAVMLFKDYVPERVSA